jgi:transposase
MRSIASQDVAKRSVPMTKLKYTPEIRERAVQLLIESEKDYPSIGLRSQLLRLRLVVLLKHFVPGIKSI